MPKKIETIINVQDEVLELYEKAKEKYSFVSIEDMIAYAIGLGIQQIKKDIAGESIYTVIEKLLKDDSISNYKISKATGIPQTTLSDYKKGKIELGKMNLDYAMKLYEFYLNYHLKS